MLNNLRVYDEVIPLRLPKLIMGCEMPGYLFVLERRK